MSITKAAHMSPHAEQVVELLFAGQNLRFDHKEGRYRNYAPSMADYRRVSREIGVSIFKLKRVYKACQNGT